jgi:hypothetical protein
MAKKIRVQLHKQGGYDEVERGATVGATLGVNLYNLDGTLVDLSAFVQQPTSTPVALELTTTGSSGAATLIGGVLNIPVYTSGGGVSDGDKGDVVVSGGGSVWTVETARIHAAMLSGEAERLTNQRSGGADWKVWTGTQAQYDALGSWDSGTQYTITDSPSGGGGNFIEAELDFGSGASDASVVITGQAGIVAGSKVNAWIYAKATTDHSADEHWLETIAVTAGNIVAGVGFTIYGKNTNMLNEPVEDYNRGGKGGKGTLLRGKFTVQASWG